MADPLLATEAVVLREQVQDHVRLVPLAVAGMGVVVAILAVAFQPVLEGWRLAVWCGSLIAPFAWRGLVAGAYRRDPDRHPLAAWRRRFRLTYAAHGAAWVLASVVLFGALDVTDQVLATCVLAGIIATSLNTAAFDRTAGLLVLVPSIASWSLRMLAEGGRVHIALGAMLALFLAYMAIYAARIHRSYTSGVVLRWAAARRAETLAGFQASFARMWQVDQDGAADVLRAVTAEVAAALQLRRAELFRFDRQAGVAVLAASVPPAASAVVVPLATLGGYLAALAGAGRLSDDGTTARPAFAGTHDTPLAPTPGRARLDLPLGGAARLSGVLCCERDAGPWSPDDEAFVTAAAATLQAAAEETGRRDAERRLRELNQTLEEVVAARTSALGQSEARLAQTLDAINDGLWDLDLVRRSVYFSPVLARLLGYLPDEMPSATEFFRAQIHPDDLGALQAVVRRHIEGAVPEVGLELRIRTRDGIYRWFVVRGKIVERSADGTPLRMLGTIGDVTARRSAVEDLHDSEMRFRALFDKSPVIVTLVDLEEGRVAEMNEVGLQAFGYDHDEVVGRTTLELGFWVDEPERRRAARRLIDTGMLSGFELQLRRKGGQPFWALLSSCVVSFQGKPFALSTLQDITERRQLEARVRQAQKLEVVGHLAGGVAHDFNNVLTVITSTAELAMSGTAEGDPMHDALQTIRQASTRAARLTGQLLAFSRQQILQPAPLDLHDAVAGVTPMLRRAVGDAVALEVRGTGAAVTVVADRGSLEQVLLNLAINARDAMPQGGTLRLTVGTAELSASSATTLPPGRYAMLAVADTGVGMSEATRARIFEPFFTTKDVGKGTGLGLSMAHGVVQQSGGDIVVTSAPGVGTTFTIYLPLSTAAPERPAPAPRGVAAGSETVLVVDDDADIREVLRRALTFAGYQVVLAGSGEEALVVMQQRQGGIDLVLTDVMMPGIGGRGLADRVRDSQPGARILFTSGYAENAIAHHGVLAAGVQFIAKPYSLQALTRKVREVLDAHAP